MSIKSSECCTINSYQELENQNSEINLSFINNSPQFERYPKKVLDTICSVQRADYYIVDEKNKCYKFVTSLKYMGRRQMR